MGQQNNVFEKLRTQLISSELIDAFMDIYNCSISKNKPVFIPDKFQNLQVLGLIIFPNLKDSITKIELTKNGCNLGSYLVNRKP